MKNRKWDRSYRWICGLICGVLVLGQLAWAQPATTVPQETSAPITAGEISGAQTTQEPTTTAESPRVDQTGRPILPAGSTGILIEETTGTILFESNSQQRMYPASTTKVMTALLVFEAIERGELALDDMVTILPEMLANLDPTGTTMGLKEGEIISIQNLIYGLMIPSGNDAARALAHAVAGSEEAFVEKMNAKAQELELKGTHFANPHGLFDEAHYTTAADMAKIARTAMEYEKFRDTVDIVHIKIPPTNMTKEERYYINTNGLLSAMRYTDFYDKRATGIKTGYTSECGYCLVSAAKVGDFSLIGVLFGGKTVKDSHEDTRRMLDYGFQQFKVVPVATPGKMLGEVKVKYGRGIDSVILSSKETIVAVVPKDAAQEDVTLRLNLPEAVHAPLEKGQVVATATALYRDEEMDTGDLCVDLAVERSFFWPALVLGDWLWSMLLIRILVYLAVIALFVGIIVLWLNLRRAAKQKKAKAQKQQGQGRR